jgi:hypothetical protein
MAPIDNQSGGRTEESSHSNSQSPQLRRQMLIQILDDALKIINETDKKTSDLRARGKSY